MTNYTTIPNPTVVPFPDGSDHEETQFNSDNRAPEPEWADGGTVTFRAGFDRDGNAYAVIATHDKGILAPTPEWVDPGTITIDADFNGKGKAFADLVGQRVIASLKPRNHDGR